MWFKHTRQVVQIVLPNVQIICQVNPQMLLLPSTVASTSTSTHCIKPTQLVFFKATTNTETTFSQTNKSISTKPYTVSTTYLIPRSFRGDNTKPPSLIAKSAVLTVPVHEESHLLARAKRDLTSYKLRKEKQIKSSKKNDVC